MESVDAKVARAEEHLNVLQVELDKFVKLIRHKTYLKTDAAKKTAWIVYHMVRPDPPIYISTIIGDCVHNMRSALDNLVCGLIRVKGTPHDCVNRQFPIMTSMDRWRNRRTEHTEGVPSGAIAVIESLQPCFGREVLGSSHPLAILQRLDNIDKHRAVLLTAGYDVHVQFSIQTTEGVRVMIYPEPIYGGPVTIPLDFDASTIPNQVKVKVRGTSLVILRELLDPDLQRVSVTVVLRGLLQFLKDLVIPKFKPFFL